MIVQINFYIGPLPFDFDIKIGLSIEMTLHVKMKIRNTAFLLIWPGPLPLSRGLDTVKLAQED